MKKNETIKYLLLIIFCTAITLHSLGRGVMSKDSLSIQFLGKSFNFHTEKKFVQQAVSEFKENQGYNFDALLDSLAPLKQNIELIQRENKLPDWFVYQLIRKIAEQINSKYSDYTQYTLTKYMLLAIAGFEPVVFTSNDKILLYVKSTDTVYNLPNKKINGKQFVCLNYHDYGYQINFGIEKFYQKEFILPTAGKYFNYTIDYLPSFQKQSYLEKKVSFKYKNKNEFYSILVSPEMRDYFSNYPVIEYRYQFTIPFSEITYNKLIPELKTRIKSLSIAEGINYLLVFVRDGFEFETDTRLFGREKRLSAEETLVYNSSDCEDRSALFFLLVKEIYNLPMAIISYTEHVNVAVQLPKNKGITVEIDNQKFTICEPTPQKIKKGIGWIPKEIRKQPFEIAYVYKK